MLVGVYSQYGIIIIKEGTRKIGTEPATERLGYPEPSSQLRAGSSLTPRISSCRSIRPTHYAAQGGQRSSASRASNPPNLLPPTRLQLMRM